MGFTHSTYTRIFINFYSFEFIIIGIFLLIVDKKKKNNNQILNLFFFAHMILYTIYIISFGCPTKKNNIIDL